MMRRTHRPMQANNRESHKKGAAFASSSATPWQRRVRLRTASAAKDKPQDPSPVVCDEEEDMAEASEFPTRPSSSQGGGASRSGLCGTLLQWLAKGQDRAAYTCQGMVFKLSEPSACV